MNKKELSEKIMQELLDNGLLNEADVDLEELEHDVASLIYDKLKDYIIITGRELE